MNPTIHSHGCYYEDFMCRAYHCYPNPRTGVYAGHYHAIYWAGHGFIKPSDVKAKKQVEKVKSYLIKATDKFLKRRLKKEEREILMIIREKLMSASSEQELFPIIDKGLVTTRRFGNYIQTSKNNVKLGAIS
jgi:hypothetical protein